MINQFICIGLASNQYKVSSPEQPIIYECLKITHTGFR
jgi:hypothetical protein